MSQLVLNITQPSDGQALTAPVALTGTATGNTAGMFFKWYSSINSQGNEAHPELPSTDFTLAALTGTQTALAEFGTHTVLLAATDRIGIDPASIQAIRRAAQAGGAPPAATAPCIVDQLAGLALRQPAALGTLSKASPVIQFLAPGPWAKQQALGSGPWVRNDDYASVNRVAIRLQLAPTSGATAANSMDILVDLLHTPLDLDRIADQTWLTYRTALPSKLVPGTHRLSLVASGGIGAGASSLSVTRQVNLTA